MRIFAWMMFASLVITGSGNAAPRAPAFTFARLGGVLRGVNLNDGGKVAVRCGGKDVDARTRRFGKLLLLRFTWQPEAACTVRWGRGAHQALRAHAPRVADPVLLKSIDLENVIPRKIEAGLSEETTFILFSPKGDRLALGTRWGHIRVLDLSSGRVVFQRRVAEGVAKAAVFSPDGKILYIGEQTRAGYIRAIHLESGRELWRYRLADDLETFVPPDPSNELAWVQYPGPYRMQVTPGGDLLVGAMHSWRPRPRAALRELSHLYRFRGKSGKLLWKWPEKGPARLKLTWFSTGDAKRTAVGILSSSDPEAHKRPMPPGLYAIDLASGKVRWRHPFQPLTPYFRTINTWRGVGVRPDGRRAAAATGDGRLYLFESGRLRWTGMQGGPVFLGRYPIVTETGAIAATKNLAIFSLGEGYIPFQTRPPGASLDHPHPNSNTLYFFEWPGKLRWRWTAPNRPNGMTRSGDGRWLALALSRNNAPNRSDINGIAIFDLSRKKPGFYAGTFRTEGLIPYAQVAITRDGTLIAAVESPAVIQDGKPPRGKHRLHVLY